MKIDGAGNSFAGTRKRNRKLMEKVFFKAEVFKFNLFLFLTGITADIKIGKFGNENTIGLVNEMLYYCTGRGLINFN